MHKFIFATLFSLCSTICFTQNVSGVITDTSDDPIIGAYVISGESHSHSNNQGRFQLMDISIGDTLMVSYLGYKNEEKIISNTDLEKGVVFVLEEESFDLEQVSISNSIKTVNVVATIDLQVNPVNSSQEILRRVPGLMIGQHAGGGKAEQIFLRGFDIDHGTDINMTVDGIPVNMVSHAHGQGYSDLHFLIPETIGNIDFGKGPYYTDQGNFNTAGYVEFKTKDKLENSVVGTEFGQFNSFRTFGLFNLLEKEEHQNAYLAAEYVMTDGPVESPQNFNRVNLMAKYNLEIDGGDRLSLLFSRFQSKWDASGQIPQRLVDQGVISRFGFVDNTEGGFTDRTNFLIDHTKIIDNNRFVKTKAYYSKYGFELFSNFTFFLEDPINGDQIRQKENRNVYGVNTTLFHSLNVGSTAVELNYGIGLRYDDINDNELSHTLNRKTTLDQISFGDVDETNLNAFINSEFDFGKWLINAGLRLDWFQFNYANNLSALYDNQSVDQALISPKFNVIYNPGPRWQLYFKSGVGFHSNDSRVVIAQEGTQILPKAYGTDLGIVIKPAPRLLLDVALWHLFLEQEFVYVGDAGIVEPSGKTNRSGIDFSMRYQLGSYVFVNADLTYTYARSLEGAEGENYIPLAVDLMSSGGLVFKHPKGFSAGLNYRYIKDRAANEDFSITAKGYVITDFNMAYQFKHLNFGIKVENLFDVDWNEAQFATTSRLKNEALPVEELHFTPGVPFFFKGSMTYKF